jgi:hypothetical protein
MNQITKGTGIVELKDSAFGEVSKGTVARGLRMVSEAKVTKVPQAAKNSMHFDLAHANDRGFAADEANRIGRVLATKVKGSKANSKAGFGPLKKNDDPFELEKSFGSAFKFAAKTVSANSRALGAIGRNSASNAFKTFKPKASFAAKTVTGNARAAGAIGAHGLTNMSTGTKIGLAAGGGAAAGGTGMYAHKRKNPF